VTLLATNSDGCGNSTKQKVTTKNSAEFFVQDAFTPNGDRENDVFIPNALQEWDVQFEMTIYNKQNKVVYKTIDRNEPWNGTLNNNGDILPKGIYMWKVITYDAEGQDHQRIGRIQIL